MILVLIYSSSVWGLVIVQVGFKASSVCMSFSGKFHFYYTQVICLRFAFSRRLVT